MIPELEAAHYYHTLSEFASLMEDYGVEQVAHDLKQMVPISFEKLQQVVLVERDKSKRAALLQYKDAFFADAVLDTNS